MPHKDPDAHRKASREGMRRQRSAGLAKIAEEVQDLANLPDVPTRDQLLRLLGVQARNGQVTAIKTLLEEQRRDANSNEAETPFAVVDELAHRRAA